MDLMEQIGEEQENIVKISMAKPLNKVWVAW